MHPHHNTTDMQFSMRSNLSDMLGIRLQGQKILVIDYRNQLITELDSEGFQIGEWIAARITPEWHPLAPLADGGIIVSPYGGPVKVYNNQGELLFNKETLSANLWHYESKPLPPSYSQFFSPASFTQNGRYGCSVSGHDLRLIERREF